MPACFQIHFQQGITIAPSQNFIIQYSPFRTRFLPVVRYRLVTLLVSDQIMHEFAALLFRSSFHDSPITFLYLAVTKHIVQSRQCLARLGKHYQPAHRTVEPMSYSHKDITRLIIFLFQPRFQHLAQRSISRLIALHNLRATLIDNNQMIVFVKDFHNLHKFQSCAKIVQTERRNKCAWIYQDSAYFFASLAK